jgi:hypothetical protein
MLPWPGSLGINPHPNIHAGFFFNTPQAPTLLLFFRNYLPGVSAASPRRILFGVRASWGCVKTFFTALRAE